jgi:hypothetical protein
MLRANPSVIRLDYAQSRHFLEENAMKSSFYWSLEPKKLLIKAENEARQTIWVFRPPLVCPRMSEGETIARYLSQISEFIPDYLIILLRAGYAALASFEEGRMVNHKVIRKYMTRQKQGKAQINHLKTKGKSRLGSRIRLQQTKGFFEEINQKLLDWEVENTDKILVSSSIALWNGLFEANILPPFTKKDTRLRKIPVHIPTPNYQLLHRVNRFVLQGQLRILDSAFQNDFGEIMQN